MDSNKRKEKLLKQINKENKKNEKNKPKAPKFEKETGKNNDTSHKMYQSEKVKSTVKREKKAYQKSLLQEEKQKENSVETTNKESRLPLKAIVVVVAAVVLISGIVALISGSISVKNGLQDQESKQETTQNEATSSAAESNPLILCENEAVSTLVTQYITAMRDVNLDVMRSLDMNQNAYNSDMQFKNTASVIEDYRDLTIYTKNGPYENGYTAYVVTNIKFKNIEKTCQGMFQYVVRMQEDGSYKVDTTQADDIEDDEIVNRMVAMSQEEDVLTLIDSVNQQCQLDVEADENLKNYVQGTLTQNASANTAEPPIGVTTQEQLTTQQETTEKATEKKKTSKKKKSKKKKESKKKKSKKKKSSKKTQ